MLKAYKQSDKKIVMGLLTYVDDFKDMDNLTKEMEKIENGSRQIYVWKDEETDNIIGLVGFDLDEENKALVVRYVSLNPSFRGNGISFEILSALADAFPDYRMMGTIENSELLKKWAVHEQVTGSHIIYKEELGQNNESGQAESGD